MTGVEPTAPAESMPDFPAILGRISDARSVMETAYKALACDADSDEITTLRLALQLLRGAYNELDLAIGRLPVTQLEYPIRQP